MTTLDSLRDRLAAVLAGLDETQSLTIAPLSARVR